MFLVLQACIGRGAHGLVFEGETSDGKAVAVKITPVNEPHNVNELAAVSDAWGRAQNPGWVWNLWMLAWFENWSSFFFGSHKPWAHPSPHLPMPLIPGSWVAWRPVPTPSSPAGPKAPSAGSCGRALWAPSAGPTSSKPLSCCRATW